MTARLGTDELAVRYSLFGAIPDVYRSDDFIERFVDGLDVVLAPVHATIDDLDAYVDPLLCPADFLQWLGTWLGVVVNRRWPIQRRREFVARAVDVYQWRGTRRGIESAVELYTGVVPEIEDTGGVSASPEPLGEIPGVAGAQVHVRLVVPGSADIAEELVDRIVTEVKPAHVRHTLELVTR